MKIKDLLNTDFAELEMKFVANYFNHAFDECQEYFDNYKDALDFLVKDDNVVVMANVSLQSAIITDACELGKLREKNDLKHQETCAVCGRTFDSSYEGELIENRSSYCQHIHKYVCGNCAEDVDFDEDDSWINEPHW